MYIAQVIQMVWPLILIQMIFQVYALIDLIVVKKRKTKNLSPIIWGVIIVLGEIIGSSLYFIIGRSDK